MTVGKKRLTTLKVDKETADLVRIYCIFNDIAVQDFVREVLEDSLEEFRERIKAIKNINRVDDSYPSAPHTTRTRATPMTSAGESND
jgi:hypothetical protein